jgi:hypothetical protein
LPACAKVRRASSLGAFCSAVADPLALRVSGVHLILEDIAVRPIAQTDLGRLLKASGGVYRREGSFFGVFTGARFVDFSTGHSGFEVSLQIDVPAAAGRRKDFWESKSGLSAGNLVALVWNDGGQQTASSGVVVSSASTEPPQGRPICAG